MEYGFSVPNRGPMATPENISVLARRGEELGFEIISVSDHIVVPRNIASRYPYSATGEFSGSESGLYLDQLSVLSFLAGQTSKAKLLTAVMVLPHRSPVLTAKMLATIDVLSCGRLIVGCGVGWMREEFEAIGAPPYRERGAVSDEYIKAFKQLWTSDDPVFEGQYCGFSNIDFLPKPVQKPHPPIWIGGESPPALRRAATLGDAWYPIGTNPRFPVGTAAQMRKYASRVRRHAEEAGRDPSELDLAYRATWSSETQELPEGGRKPFTGAPEQVVSDLAAFAEVGVKHIHFDFQGSSLDESLERMERFATEIRPSGP